MFFVIATLSSYSDEAVVDAYGAQPGDKYFSVLLHDKLNELPRTYIAICGKDTLRDDSRLFVEALESAGYGSSPA